MAKSANIVLDKQNFKCLPNIVCPFGRGLKMVDNDNSKTDICILINILKQSRSLILADLYLLQDFLGISSIKNTENAESIQ